MKKNRLTCKYSGKESNAVAWTIVYSIVAIQLAILLPLSGISLKTAAEKTITNNSESEIIVGENIKVTDDNGSGAYPSIAIKHNVIYVAWEDGREIPGTIYFSKSVDGGKTFTPNVKVGDSQKFSASIAVDDSENIYISYSGLRLAKSTDGGNTWVTDIQVTYTPVIYGYSTIIWDNVSGNLYMAWSDEKGILFAKSPDGGESWSKNITVNDSSLGYVRGSVSGAVDSSGTIYLAWPDGRDCDMYSCNVFFSRSSDEGGNWSKNIRINDVNGTAYSPAITIDSNDNLYTVWSQSGSIYFASSRDKGATWSAGVKVSDNNTVRAHGACIAATGSDNIYVAWTDERGGQYHGQVYFAISTNGGINWSENVKVNNGSTGGASSIATNSFGQACIVWAVGGNNTYDIYFSKITVTSSHLPPPLQQGWRVILINGAIVISVICAAIAVIMILRKLRKGR